MLDRLEQILHKQEDLFIKISLASIFLFASVIFFIGFDYELPIVELDEGYLLGVTFEQRGLGIDVDNVPSYPPIIIALLHGSEFIVEWYTSESALYHTGDVIAILRFLNIGVNLLSLVFVYLLASQLANRHSGLVAAFAFAIMPEIFEHIRLALTESWQILFITISLYALLKTLNKKQSFWAIVCTISGLLAICAKYSTFPVLGLGIGSTIWLVIKDNKQWIRILAIQVILIAITAYLLLYSYGAAELLNSTRPEISQLTNQGSSKLLDFMFVWSLFREAFQGIGFSPLMYLGLLAIGTIAFWRQQESEQRVAWFLIIIFAVSFTWIVATYLTYSSTRDRYVIPASTAWIALAATCITAIVQSLPKRINHSSIQIALIGIICFLWLQPHIRYRFEIVRTFSSQYTSTGLAQWSGRSLPPGTIALDNNKWAIFDPIWGGYSGPTRPWTNREDWRKRPLEDWLANNVYYVQYSGAYPGTNPEFLFQHEDLLYLKSFPIPSEEDKWSGPLFHIYRVLPIENDHINITFGEQIILRGYDLSNKQLSGGESLSWTPYWQIMIQPQNDYQLFLHLVPMDSFDVIAQTDSTPALVTRPTSTWDDPNETIIGNTFTITIPETIEPGDYRLIAGLYHLETFARLSSDEALDYFVIDTITITD